MDNVKNNTGDGDGDLSSSPPTPPSPLPLSYGPGNQKYSFSASPTPSPPFSIHSSHTSAENHSLLPEKLPSPKVPTAFSLDRVEAIRDQMDSRKSSSCLQELLEWFIERCCSCCTRYP